MLLAVITSLLLATITILRDIIPLKLSEGWEQNLEVRILILLSLSLQIMLITLGSHRRKAAHPWTRMAVWGAYVLADAIALYALGVIRCEPISVSSDRRGCNTTDKISDLRVFWATFLLMHLGGPDTITAYALQDNDLWQRHCFTMVSQAGGTLYLLYLSWNGSDISWLSIAILICGLIKYGERIWVLWAASTKRFQESTPKRPRKILRIVEEQKLKEAEGYVVVTHRVISLSKGLEDSGTAVEPRPKSQEEIRIARDLVEIFRPAFTDQMLSMDDSDVGRLQLPKKHYLSVFNIIAIELGFVYDLLFTKATVLYSPWGFANRVISLSLTSTSLVVFATLSKNASYGNIDRCLTLALLGIAVFLELYAILSHLLSDRVTYWLDEHKQTFISNVINRLHPLERRQRWSNKIGQFSLLSYSLKEKHYFCGLNILGFYHSYHPVSDNVKRRLYDHIYSTRPALPYTGLQSLWVDLLKDPLKEKQLARLKWSIELDFDMCILIWHIATDICVHEFLNYYESPETENDLLILSFVHDDASRKAKDILDCTHDGARVSLDLSRYMLHLLVMYPSLLPVGVGCIEFEDMHSALTTFFKQHKIPSDAAAREQLRQIVNTQLNLTVSSRDTSKSVMFYACLLTTQLMEMKQSSRIDLVCMTWVRMLILAALKCKANSHMQQLNCGGELLTHVWLLLIHFGMTDHFKIPNATEIAELIIK